MITRLSRYVRSAIFMPINRPINRPLNGPLNGPSAAVAPAFVFSEPIFPHLQPQEFGRFASLLRDDEGFPRTYGNWLSRTAQPEGRLAVRSVDVGYDEFLAYCRNCGQAPGLVTLMACASAKMAGSIEPATRRH